MRIEPGHFDETVAQIIALPEVEDTIPYHTVR